MRHPQQIACGIWSMGLKDRPELLQIGMAGWDVGGQGIDGHQLIGLINHTLHALEQFAALFMVLANFEIIGEFLQLAP